MRLDRNVAAVRIARQLKTAEKQADDALLALSDLMSTLLRARADIHGVPHTGQAALMRLVQAQQSFISGSNDLFRVHDVMSSIGREMGVLDEPNSTPEFGELHDEVKIAA